MNLSIQEKAALALKRLPVESTDEILRSVMAAVLEDRFTERDIERAMRKAQDFDFALVKIVRFRCNELFVHGLLEPAAGVCGGKGWRFSALAQARYPELFAMRAELQAIQKKKKPKGKAKKVDSGTTPET